MRRSAAWFLIGIFLLSGCGASQDTAGDMQQDRGQETVTSPEDENENGEMNMTSANRQIRVTAEDGGEIIFELNESTAASDLYGQLPLSVEIENFSDNEKIFYPEELDTSDTPLAEMEIGTLAYYEPWGDVVMFYGEYSENSSLYELGHVVSGGELIPELADHRGVSMTEISLAWLLTKVTSPVVGATKLSHVDGMAKAVDICLTKEEINYLEEPYVPHKLAGVMAQNTAEQEEVV